MKRNTKNRHYVVVDTDTKVYDGTDPVFTETDHGILLKDNAFTMRL